MYQFAIRLRPSFATKNSFIRPDTMGVSTTVEDPKVEQGNHWYVIQCFDTMLPGTGYCASSLHCKYTVVRYDTVILFVGVMQLRDCLYFLVFS